VFDHRHYVPILLTKRGERRGVSDLDPAVKGRMTPLFVVPPVDWDYESEAPAKTIDQHLAPVGSDIAACWGAEPAFVDLYFTEDHERMSSGQHPLAYVIEQGNVAGASLIPTISLSRDAAYRAAVAAAHARDGRGICVRLPLAEWPSATGAAALNDLLTDLSISPAEVDLILDLETEVVGSPGLVTAVARTELASLPRIRDWRSLTVASAGFPLPPLNYAKGISVIDREDWLAYQSVATGVAPPRMPTFADYGAGTLDPTVDVDPRVMSISATFRYAVPDAWLFAKGDLFKGRAGLGMGGAAMVPVASALSSHPLFAGASHCAGDQFVINAAAGNGGNPEGWRRAATTHHLTHVVTEIANLHGASGAP
jgi:hypothetical protein